MEQRPQFDSRFLIGIEQVDNEHRRLFEIAANVYDALGASDMVAIAAARAAIAELHDFTAKHFASEEALMEAAGYPGLAEHSAVHHHLLSQTHDMEVRAEIGKQYVPAELSHFLYSWLIEHIQTYDKKFGEFMAALSK